MLWLFYVNRETFVWVLCQSQAPEIEVKLLVFFTFLINLFMKTLISSSIYCKTVPSEHLGTYVCCKNCMSSISAFVLNLSKTGKTLFRKIANGNCLLCSVSLLLVGKATHWCINLEWWQLLRYMKMQHIMPNILHWNQFLEKASR